ncbi:tyrosine-protein kinase HTK16-like [Dreissena polymorpha]|uniref:tyrosine-protein kinase HTK16-like n=1 Tax=Dreissena polymorpha TaxID=45954 RepID=UPI0022644318|nr:tyrosine-protein kinase HTK16-like [Dreissena polymorpha]
MDQDSDDEKCDSIYANEETAELMNVSFRLESNSLEDLLKEDQEKIKEREGDKQWYHGRITRDVAEDILRKGLLKYGNHDGLFLVRESSFSTTSFVLSLYSKGEFFHFQITMVKPCHFSIDEGPVIHGLDRLIKNYQEKAQGLPTNLTLFCKCKAPPDEQRQKGATNLLHRAVLENIPKVLEDILKSKNCPPINAKTDWGSTALHDACYYGFEDCADILVRNGANVNCLDKDGSTPLHKCCSGNKAGIISILINEGKANVNERNPKSGWSPLHMAAFKGHLECIKILLDFHSPYLPRAYDGTTTPLDLAENYSRQECLKEIDNFVPSKIVTHKKDWFHPEIDRAGAQKILELKGLREGLFLVRSSNKNPDWQVLTICHNQQVYNYQIKTKHYREKLIYYIDDGPYYKHIEHVIQYYSYSANGLPCALRFSVNPAQELIQITCDDEYFNLVDSSQLPAPIKLPSLPPRPDDMLLKQSTADGVDYSSSLKRVSNLSPPQSPKPKTGPPPPPNHPPPAVAKQMSTSHYPPEKPVMELRRIDIKLLKLGKEIGQGEFGSVVKGVYSTKDGKNKKKMDVAVKLFHKTAINNQEDFLKEARTMQQLSHECIVNFLGISESENHELLLVEEFIEKGSMLDFLLDHPKQVKCQDLYLWAAQIAYGMMYLEEQKMVHRDLAARNILLQSITKAKISDFGLSRAVGQNSDYYKATTGGRWPIKWYAPECVNYGHFSHASDVWSFGVTLWEMFSYGLPPYDNMKGIDVIKFIEEGKRLEKPSACPDMVYAEMLKCWSKEAKDRPTFKKLNTHFAEEDEYASTREVMKPIRTKE